MNLWSKPIGLNHKPVCIGSQETTLTIAIYYYSARPKANTHFTIPRRLEGWVMAWSWRATFMWQPLWHCDVPYSVSFLVTFLRSIEKTHKKG